MYAGLNGMNPSRWDALEWNQAINRRRDYLKVVHDFFKYASTDQAT